MAKKRYVVVGTGGRAISFIRPMVTRFGSDCELVGLCDVSRTRMAHYNTILTGELGCEKVRTYTPDEFDRMMHIERPGCVLITSKDSTHEDYIVRALRHGSDVITEKPMTIGAEGCRNILQAVKETGGKVRVAFNYRWTAHRSKTKELIQNGTIGRVMSVNVEYLLDTNHGADYYRRWHSRMAESGGLLVHKSTHHFDLVNWWLDSIPEQVFAHGRLDFYGRQNAIVRGDEALTRYKRYTDEPAAVDDPFRLNLREDPDLRALYLEAEPDNGYIRDQNVFREGIDIYDNMSAVVRYRTGALLTYSLLSYSPREGMRVTLNGDRGRLEYYEFCRTRQVCGQREDVLSTSSATADDAVEYIRVYPHFGEGYEAPVVQLPGTHGGADPVLAEQLFSSEPPIDLLARAAGHEQGAASVLVGIAANQSIEQNRAVNISDLLSLRPEATRLSQLI